MYCTIRNSYILVSNTFQIIKITVLNLKVKTS